MRKNGLIWVLALLLAVGGALGEEGTFPNGMFPGIFVGEMDALGQHYDVEVAKTDKVYRVRLRSADPIAMPDADSDRDFWLLLKMEDGSWIEPDSGIVQNHFWEEQFLLPENGQKPSEVHLMGTSSEGTFRMATCVLKSME